MEQADLMALRDSFEDPRDRACTTVAAFGLRSERREHEHAEPTWRCVQRQIQSEGSTRRVTLRTADSILRRGRR